METFPFSTIFEQVLIICNRQTGTSRQRSPQGLYGQVKVIHNVYLIMAKPLCFKCFGTDNGHLSPIYKLQVNGFQTNVSQDHFAGIKATQSQ